VNCNYDQSLQNIEVLINKLEISDYSNLSNQWLTLEKKSTTHFFLSWNWINAWLKIISNNFPLYLVTAKINQKVVGLGIFVERRTAKYVFFRRKEWYLHRTGNDAMDQIWIENNNFLVGDHNKNIILSTIWQQLLKQKPEVDEFIIAMQHNSNNAEPAALPLHYTKKKIYTEKGYYLSMVDLKSFDQYLSLLSKNTRQQIKRSIKLLKQLGDVQFNVITEENKQWNLLQQSKHWHIEKWQQTSTPSGFCNPLFTDFHKYLIFAKHSPTKSIVASLQIDNELVGCLYCFIDGESVYFYLSTLKPMSDNRIKLGLTIHAFFIEWLIDNAPHITKYDFLAGDARYKKSLTNKQNEYSYLVIQKQSLKFWLEDKLKLIKNAFK
jgi:hypothetical protein